MSSDKSVIAEWEGVCGIVAADGQRMCLRIEDPLLEREEVVIGEDEVEVLERLREEEGLLRVVLAGGYGHDVVNARVAAPGAAVPVEGLRRRPGVLPIAVVVRQAPHHKVALNHLRSIWEYLGSGEGKQRISNESD